MKSVNYEKPSMKFVDLRSEQVIAAPDGPCMAQAASAGVHDFYYDVPGDGWLHLYVQAETCKGQGNVQITYVDNKDIPGQADQDIINQTIAKVKSLLKGGEKQQFEGAVINEPDPSWS